MPARYHERFCTEARASKLFVTNERVLGYVLPAVRTLDGVAQQRHDLSFDLGEAERYRKDVPNAEVHILDAGHFALDTAADEIAALVRSFVGSSSRGLLTQRAG